MKYLTLLIAIAALYLSFYGTVLWPRRKFVFDLFNEFLEFRMREYYTKCREALPNMRNSKSELLKISVAIIKMDGLRFTSYSSLTNGIYDPMPEDHCMDINELNSVISSMQRYMEIEDFKKRVEYLKEAEPDQRFFIIFLDFMNKREYIRRHDEESDKDEIDERSRLIQSFQIVENFYYKTALFYFNNILTRSISRKLFKDEFNILMDDKGFRIICEEMSKTEKAKKGNFPWATVLPEFQDRLNSDCFISDWIPEMFLKHGKCLINKLFNSSV